MNALLKFLVLTFLLQTSKSTPIPANNTAMDKYGNALEAIFSIGIKLQALIDDKESSQNFLVSPISATVIIGQLMLGAKGAFLEQLRDLLSFTSTNENSHLTWASENKTHTVPHGKFHLELGSLLRHLNRNAKIFTLKSTNALFYEKTENLRPSFAYNMEKIYNTQLNALNFAGDPLLSQMIINEWASYYTNGLIKTVLSEPPSRQTSAIFANAIYFIGEWDTPFSYQLNRNGSFRTQHGTVNVTYMQGELEDIPYVENKTLGCKMIALPYKQNELSMYIILPDENVLRTKEFASKFKAANVLEMMSNTKKSQVSVKLPKLSLSSTFSILEPLIKYSSFKRHAKFQNTNGTNVLDELQNRIKEFERFNQTENVDIYLTEASDHNLRVSNILQQIRFSIDEKGTEAAAVTAGSIDYMGGSKSFLVDKPFMFFIRHEETSATIFWGTIMDPTKSN